MRAKPTIVSMLPLILAVAAGCGSRGSLYVSPLTPLPAVASPEAVVSVVPVTSRAVLVRPGGAAPEGVRISKGARHAALTPQGDRLVVLAGDAAGPRLDVVTLGTGEVATLATHGLFDEITFSKDGALAVLTYAAVARVAGLAARNLNEVEVVDLAAHTSARLQLDTGSLAPRGVLFAPRVGTRQLVAVTFDKGVAVFDALQPTLAPRRIAVRPASSTEEISILEALFSPDAHFLYLRAQGLDDVVVVELRDTGTRLEPSLNFLAGGTGLSDLELPLGEGQHEAVLAVYATSQEALLLDARGNDDKRVRLQLTDYLTRAHARADGTVLLYDAGRRTVAAWDPSRGKSGTVALDAPFAGVVFADDQGRAVFDHPGALSVVSVEEEASRLRLKVRAIQLAGGLSGRPVLDGSGRLFLANGENGTGYLVRLDLGSLELAQLALEEPAAEVMWLQAAGRVAVMHAGGQSLSFVDAQTLDRASSERVQGWALTGDFDRPEEE